MKHLKKFNESEVTKPVITFEEAKQWILQNYEEDKVIEMFDDEVDGGNWIDTDQMEEEGYESNYDYYNNYGHGEAEDAIKEQIIKHLKSQFELGFNLIADDTDIYDFLNDTYDVLNN